MKLFAVRVLMVVNVALAGLLTWLWFTPDGNVRNTHWVPPSPLAPRLSDLLPELALAQSGADMNHFMATLDRPLFSATRRPPPPPAPVQAALPPPPPDPLASVLLSGVFGDAENGGVIARVDGKTRIVRLNEPVGAWRLKAIQDSDVTFVRGDETRVIRLIRLRALPPASETNAESSPPRPANPRQRFTR